MGKSTMDAIRESLAAGSYPAASTRAPGFVSAAANALMESAYEGDKELLPPNVADGSLSFVAEMNRAVAHGLEGANVARQQ